MRIVDAHHHLWNLRACQYPWLMARGVRRFFGDPAPIQKNYLVDDLREDPANYELAGSVHVQVGAAPGDEVVETQWLQTVGDEQGLPSAIVAYCDLAADDVERRLDQQVQYPRLRGIRQIVGRSEEEDAKTGSDSLLDDPRWREGLCLLRDRDLSFDLQLIPRQTFRAAELFADVAGLRVALCHCGSPWDQSDSGIADWRAGLTALAVNPKVFCKISGLGMFDHDWTVESIRRLVESCIEIFGVDRCMFGSNFPVDKLHASYDDVWGAFGEITSALSEADRQKLFCGNAAEFYRLGI